jgi:hypothetical protein
MSLFGMLGRFFDVTHDRWILWKHVHLETITVYEQILTNGTVLGRTADKVKLVNFIGKQGPFSALAQHVNKCEYNLTGFKGLTICLT